VSATAVRVLVRIIVEGAELGSKSRNNPKPVARAAREFAGRSCAFAPASCTLWFDAVFLRLPSGKCVLDGGKPRVGSLTDGTGRREEQLWRSKHWWD